MMTAVDQMILISHLFRLNAITPVVRVLACAVERFSPKIL